MRINVAFVLACAVLFTHLCQWTASAEEIAEADKKVLHSFMDGKTKLAQVEAHYKSLKEGKEVFARTMLSTVKEMVKKAQAELDERNKDLAYNKKQAQENPKHFGLRNIQEAEQRAEVAKKKLSALQNDLTRVEKEYAPPEKPPEKTTDILEKTVEQKTME